MRLLGSFDGDVLIQNPRRDDDWPLREYERLAEDADGAEVKWYPDYGHRWARRPTPTGRSGSPRSSPAVSTISPMRIGVLAIQGDFREHAAVLRRLGAEPVEVRKADELDGLDGLVIPGGESTAIMRLARIYGLEEALRRFDRPVFGTCAGMILLDRDHLGLMDVGATERLRPPGASFEADLEVAGQDEPVRGVFIRAPRWRPRGGCRGARRARR